MLFPKSKARINHIKIHLNYQQKVRNVQTKTYKFKNNKFFPPLHCETLPPFRITHFSKQFQTIKAKSLKKKFILQRKLPGLSNLI